MQSAVNHPFFGADNNQDGISDRIVFNFDFADNENDGNAQDIILSGHGSNVASIAASGDPIVQGVAPGANVIALKVFETNFDPNTQQMRPAIGVDAAIEQALQWVVANAEAFNIASVNLSLGDEKNHTNTIDNHDWSDELAAIVRRNVIVVAAAGNDFFESESQQGVAYPAADPNTIAVGAVFDGNVGMYGRFDDLNGDGIRETLRDDIRAAAYTTNADRITPFSQRHATLTDIFAPGAFIRGANANGGINDLAGTSQASPHVAGMAVLAQQLAQQQLFRLLTPAEFRDLLINTGTQIFDEEGDQNGNGVIDGHEEHDNVTNTGLGFRRADMLALAQGIMNLRPPDNLNIDLSGAGFDIVDRFTYTESGVTVNFQVQNTGLDTAGAFDVDFYLSADGTITQHDYLISSFRFNGLESQSLSSNLSTILTLPVPSNPIWRSFGNGFGFIGMFVDANNEVGEPNAEYNNINTGWGIDFDGVEIYQQGTVTITVNRVHAIDNLDLDRAERNEPADFYTKLYINGVGWKSSDIGNDNDINPNWQSSLYVAGRITIPLTIQIWEEDDDRPDGQVDINPNSGFTDLELSYNLFTGELFDIFGNLIGQGVQKGQELDQERQIHSIGGGDLWRGEIWFTVSFG